MSLTSIRPFSLLLIFFILILLFGSSRLKHLGRDLGEAIRGFKEGLQGGDSHPHSKREEVLPPTPASQSTSSTSQQKHD